MQVGMLVERERNSMIAEGRWDQLCLGSLFFMRGSPFHIIGCANGACQPENILRQTPKTFTGRHRLAKSTTMAGGRACIRVCVYVCMYVRVRV